MFWKRDEHCFEGFGCFLWRKVVFPCSSHKSDNDVYTHQIVILFAWIHHGNNNWQSYHEISNKTKLMCLKFHPQQSHNQLNWILNNHYHSTFIIPTYSWWWYYYYYHYYCFFNSVVNIKNFLKLLQLNWAKKCQLILYYLGTLHHQSFRASNQ